MIECPACGHEVDVYAQSEPEDASTTLLVDHKHDDSVECLKGCNRVTRSYWQAYCDGCEELLDVIDEYIQPCNANGYPFQLWAFKPEVLTPHLVELWLQGDIKIRTFIMLVEGQSAQTSEPSIKMG